MIWFSQRNISLSLSFRKTKFDIPIFWQISGNISEMIKDMHTVNKSNTIRKSCVTYWTMLWKRQLPNKLTDHMWPNCEPCWARKFRCAIQVVRKQFVPSSSCKGRRRRTETRSRSNPVHRGSRWMLFEWKSALYAVTNRVKNAPVFIDDVDAALQIRVVTSITPLIRFRRL